MVVGMANRIVWVGLALACASCGNEIADDPPGDTGGTGPASGGTPASGGNLGTGGSATGGTNPSTGGNAVGGAATGGTTTGTGGKATGGVATGGTATGGKATGGVATGGTATGGKATGGVATGGTATGGTAIGGTPAGGQASGGIATGGKATGGTATGGKATGGTATGGTSGGCSVAPVNPNATQAVRNVLCYLYQINKQSTLSGVQDCHWSPISDVTYVYNTTGVYPAVVGGDFLYTNAVSQATTAWNSGSLSMIRYHMGRPEDADSYESSMGTTDLAATLTPGTSRYNGLMTKFNHASSELLRLQAAGVVVLWAPFHEVQPGGWFWWSKGTADQFKQLWNLMFTDFASKGVNNVIWLLPYSGSPNASHYPGKAVVDISGSDTYGDSQPFANNYTRTVSAVGSTTMPLALHETGYVPNPTSMFTNNAAPWVLFSVWCNDWVQNTSRNTAAELRQAFVNTRTINRGQLPRF
jgi:hypothetical protein